MMVNLNEQASKCSSCLEWHKHCKAECCKIILMPLDQCKVTKNSIMIRKNVTRDMHWYYKLHGVKIVHGLLVFPKSKCVISMDRVWYVRPCDLLKDNKCLGHPDKKPHFCRNFTEETAMKYTHHLVTPNCLYAYKNEFCKKIVERFYTPHEIQMFKNIGGDSDESD